MTKEEIKREKILNGNINQTIITIAFPIIVFGFVNAFFCVFDSLIVSYISVDSISAVAALLQIKNLIAALALGLSAGGSVVISRYIGSGNYEYAKKSANVLVTLTFLLSFIIISLSLIFQTPFMKLAGVPYDLIDMGRGYFIISFIELFFLYFNNVFYGIQKSRASTKSVFYLNISGMGIKVIFSLLFVFVFKFKDIKYVALATLISQVFISFIALYLLTKKDNILCVRFKTLHLDKELVKKILNVSLPIFFGKFLFSLGKVSVNKICLGYGSVVVGALSVSGNINAMGVCSTNAFEEIESGMVSQNIGNKNIKRTIQIFYRTVLISFFLGITLFICIRFIFLDEIFYLFTLNNDSASPNFIENVRKIFYFESLSMMSLAINSAILGLFYGFGKTKITMFINLAQLFILRIPLLLFLQKFFPSLAATSVGMAVAFSNVFILMFSLPFAIFFIRKLKKQNYECEL